MPGLEARGAEVWGGASETGGVTEVCPLALSCDETPTNMPRANSATVLICILQTTPVSIDGMARRARPGRKISGPAGPSKRRRPGWSEAAVADRGYCDGEEIKACEEAAITVTLPKPAAANAPECTRLRDFHTAWTQGGP